MHAVAVSSQLLVGRIRQQGANDMEMIVPLPRHTPGLPQECLSIMHSSWIFNIDNEWIFVVIVKTGPDLERGFSGPSFSPDDR